MQRRFAQFLTVISLLCCWASVMLWEHSLYWTDVFTWTRWTTVDSSTAALRQVALGFGHGRVRLDYERSTFRTAKLIGVVQKYTPAGFGGHIYHDSDMSTFVFDSRWWVAGTTNKTGPGMSQSMSQYQGPTAVLTAVFAVLPVIGLKRWATQKHRKRKGLCLVCGYDLSATPGRCPECGGGIVAQ